MSLTALNRRILELSHKHHLSHIGSCLGAAPILDEIYSQKRLDEPFILSAGHCGLALYTVLEKYHGKDAEELLLKHGIHPNRDLDDGIDCSTGSLGMGVGIAVGRALADRTRRVYCLISDGELSEGIVAESLRFATRENLQNLHVYININGYSAMREVLRSESVQFALAIFPWINLRIHHPQDYGIPFLSGLDAHYKVMSNEDWKWVEAQEIVE